MAAGSAGAGGRVPTVTVYPDGPLVLRGGIEVRDESGNLIKTGTTVALCRCGRSGMKPICDGSHKIDRTNRVLRR